MHNSSFFDSIKSHIPSIDSDLSSSDNEEEISIYQRPSVLRFPQDNELGTDLDCLSLEEPELEELLKSVTQPFLYSSDEGSSGQRDDLGLLPPAEHRDHLAQDTGHELEKPIINSAKPESTTSESMDNSKPLNKNLQLVNEQIKCDCDRNERSSCTSPALARPENKRSLKKSAGDVCRAQSVERREVLNTQSFPVLSLGPLENWDLDEVLRSLKQHGHHKKPVQKKPVPFQPFRYTDYESQRPDNNIMEQLAAFCKKQECKEMESETISSSEKVHSKRQKPYIKRPTDTRIDGWTNDFTGITKRLHLKKEDSPTVYIDLRNTEHQTKPAFTCNIYPVTLHHDLLKQAPPTVRVGHTQPEADRKRGILTGKSLLLQKIRESNRVRAASSDRRKAPEGSAEGQQEINTEVRLDQPQCRKLLPHKHLDKISFPTTTCDEAAAPGTQTLSSHKKADGQPQNNESERGRKEEQMTRVRQQQYLKHLQTFRPQRSTHGKQSAAILTDVLYDTDGSYLPSRTTLPLGVRSRERVLLIVNLLNPGVVAGKAQGKMHPVKSTSVMSHVYNALIAWFTSLAEPNKCTTKDRNAAPFWVGGLQQLWRDDALVLYVCAVSHEESQSLRMKSRRRDVEMGLSLFHQQVSRFLSQTQLKTVVSWLPQLNHLLEQQAYPSVISLPSSCLSHFISINPDREAVERAFGMNPGFYWQTIETRDQICQRAEVASQHSHTEVVFALGYQQLFLNPVATHHTFQLALASGLDVCGLCLAYPSSELLANDGVYVTGSHRGEYSQGPVLTLAFRGPYARSVWQDIIGPSDPWLARKTDPASIHGLHCCSRGPALLHSPRLDDRVHLALCVWFGGRAKHQGCVDMVAEQLCSSSDTGNRKDTEDKGDQAIFTEAAALCATVKADVFLLVSPVVVPCCYSHVLSACAKRGFQLLGLQRVHISSKQAPSLGLTPEQVSVFCGAPAVSLAGRLLDVSSHCLVLLLRRENALRHCATLPAGVMTELAVKGLQDVIRAGLVGGAQLKPHLCFHTVAYMENHFNLLGGFMWAVPDFSRVVLASHRYLSCSETEQIVVLALTGSHIMEQEMRLLHKVLRGNVAGGVGQDRFELLTLKWLPSLARQQAQELSPFEVGERRWRSSVASLASSPALVCVLRRPQAFRMLRSLMPCDYPGNLSILMSSTPETAFRQASVFFNEEELVPDHSSRMMLKFLPPPSRGFRTQCFYSYMMEGPLPLLTLALMKPGVWRHCLGKILSKIQQQGFAVVGLRVLVLERETADALRHVLGPQVTCERELELKHLTSGPALILCLQRVNAVQQLLELLGSDDPTQDCAEQPHGWWTRPGSDKLHSAIYGSVSYQQAVQQVKMMFSEGLCCTETAVMKHEQIPCLNSDHLASLEREQSHTVAAIPKNNLSESLIKDSEQLGAGGSLRSALCQTTCLLMPSSLLQLSQTTLHLDLLQQLLGTGCHLVAGRLSKPDKDQRKHICELLRPPGHGVANEILLAEGPCLILALQKDNIVTCFDSILESICRGRPDFDKASKLLLSPRTENKAVKLLCYLFDTLAPDSYHSIVPRL